METPNRTPTRPDLIDNLNLLLTGRCNLACTYCYQGHRQGGPTPWPHLRRALDWALRHAGDELEISLSGGEPLLCRRTVRRVLAYVARRAPPGLQVRFALLTNGLLLDAELFGELVRHGVETRISTDGTAFAQRARGPDTPARLADVLTALRRADPQGFARCAVAAMTVTPANARHLADGVAQLLAAGFRRIDIGPVLTPCPGWHESSFAVLQEEFRRIAQRCLAEREETGDFPVGLLDHRGPPASAPGIPDSSCGATGPRKLAIDRDGRAYSCTLLAGSVGIGGGRTTPWSQAACLGRPGTAAFRRRRATLTPRMQALPPFRPQPDRRGLFGRCGDCRHGAGCRICPAALIPATQRPGPPEVPAFVCAFNAAADDVRRTVPARPVPATAEIHPLVIARGNAAFRAEIDRILAVGRPTDGSPGTTDQSASSPMSSLMSSGGIGPSQACPSCRYQSNQARVRCR